ncbi:MAG: nucleotidyltransferase family protein [Patescibacteria group bacterium]
MKAVVLAAGKGKRMRPLTLTKPKSLLKVGGKTFLEHIFHALPSEVDEVLVVIGHKRAQIKEFLGNKYAGKKVYYVVQKKNNGTGPATLLARPYFKNKERFLLIYADELVTKKEIRDCLAHEFSWLSRYYDKPEESGVATLRRGRLIDVVEKPKHPASNFVVGGLMVINADIFRYKPVRHRSGEYPVSSMMKKFIKNHKVVAVQGRDNLSFSTKAEVDKFNKSK